MESPLESLVDSKQQQDFGVAKESALPKYCRECDVRFACNGECPKHRFLTTPDGEPGLNYLCAGYKKFLHHIDPHMQAMAGLLQSRRPAADIMEMIASYNDKVGGIDSVSLHFTPGNMPVEVAERSLRLFSSEVLPKVAEL